MSNARKCGKCGGSIVNGVRDTNRRYCSVECREAYWAEKRCKGVTRGEWLKGRYATPEVRVRLTIADAAYVAGFMDGEGHIGIGREARKGNSSGYRYSVSMEIANTNKAVLERVNAALGGNGWVSNSEPNQQRYPNAKPLYRIRFSRRQIAHVLPQLLPYLTVKRDVAGVALRFIALMDQAPMRTSQFHERFEALYQEARVLNRRGM